MNRAGRGSWSYRGDEMCALYHFLENEEGERESKEERGMSLRGRRRAGQKGGRREVMDPVMTSYSLLALLKSDYRSRALTVVGVLLL